LLRHIPTSVKKEYPLNSGYFTAISSCSVKTVAVRYKHAMLLIVTNTGRGLYSFINTDDLEPPKIRGFLKNFRDFGLRHTF